MWQKNKFWSITLELAVAWVQDFTITVQFNTSHNNNVLKKDQSQLSLIEHRWENWSKDPDRTAAVSEK